jgi:hypothetical protein
MPGVSIRGVSHEGEEIRYQRRINAEFLAHTGCIAYLVAAPVHLYYAVDRDALREIFIRCPDANFFHALVLRRNACGRGKRIVGLELGHRPHCDAHSGKRLFKRMELS